MRSSPEPIATLYDTPETQSTGQRAQRRQGRAGRGAAASLSYGRPQLYGRESLETMAGTL